MECLHPFIHDGVWLPCGKCLPCRIRKKREWIARLNYELSSFHGNALFLTLTYRDEFLPKTGDGVPTLQKRDLQLFFKRLRKRLKGRKIKYFACGEYGLKENALKYNSSWRSPEGRPHYHAIVFGVNLSDVPIIRDCWSLDDNADWRWDPINKSAVGFVERDSIGYVAGYVQKKMDKRKGSSVDDVLGLQPPFQVQSQGIGYDYIDTHAVEILRDGFISDGKHIIGLPQTLKRHLGVDAVGRRLSVLNNIECVKYFDKIDERKELYSSEKWQKTSEKRKLAWNANVRGQAFCDYMSNVQSATVATKTMYQEALARKNINITGDLL